MRAAKIYLILIAVFSIAIGLVYLIAPSVMTAPFGLGELGPSALTDVRANYGGFQIGTGLFMLFAYPTTDESWAAAGAAAGCHGHDFARDRFGSGR
jgi:hypothetical protein